MREWNADSYHQVSTPQFDWGLVVLDRLSLEGHELVFDIGCGTGRLTEKVLERLPRGRVVGIDMSSNMRRATSATRLMFSTRSASVKPRSLLSPCRTLSPSRIYVCRPSACLIDE